MTKRDFIIIAEVVNGMEVDYNLRSRLAQSFAKRLSDTNDRFKRDVFVEACMKGHSPHEDNDE